MGYKDREDRPDPVEPSPSGELTERNRFVARYDPSSDRTLCAAVVDAVAAVTGNSPTELPPLHDSVNTDAMTDIVRSADAEASTTSVRFEFGGTMVTVVAGGAIYVDGPE
jgi:hypothetical protein